MEFDKTHIHTPCVEVRDFSPIPALAADMLKLLYRGDKHVYLGLASNQVGLCRRFFVMDCTGFKGVMVNPIIEKLRGGCAFAAEGCASFKGSAYINRFKIINVSWQDEHGLPHRAKYRGLIARVIQHEIDHLNGITMYDREKMPI